MTTTTRGGEMKVVYHNGEARRRVYIGEETREKERTNLIKLYQELVDYLKSEKKLLETKMDFLFT